MSLWDVPTPEVWHLIRRLLVNSRSQLMAAFIGWTSTINPEQAVLMDLYDLYVKSHFKPPHTPYPRPWDKKKTVKKRTATQALAILRPQRRTDG